MQRIGHDAAHVITSQICRRTFQPTPSVFARRIGKLRLSRDCPIELGRPPWRLSGRQTEDGNGSGAATARSRRAQKETAATKGRRNAKETPAQTEVPAGVLAGPKTAAAP